MPHPERVNLCRCRNITIDKNKYPVFGYGFGFYSSIFIALAKKMVVILVPKVIIFQKSVFLVITLTLNSVL